jgi:hypothetical protein
MAEDKDKDPLVGIGIRIPRSMKTALDSAAWAEGVSLTHLVLAGVKAVLAAVQKKHGGKIPPKPKAAEALWVLPGSEPQTPKKRGKK